MRRLFNPQYHKIRYVVKLDAFILSELHLKPQSYSLFVLLFPGCHHHRATAISYTAFDFCCVFVTLRFCMCVSFFLNYLILFVSDYAGVVLLECNRASA